MLFGFLRREGKEIKNKKRERVKEVRGWRDNKPNKPLNSEY